MDYFVFVGSVLLLMFSPAAPMCVPTDYALYVEKPECNFCVAINTTICMGFCYSRDSNMGDLVGLRFLLQRGCTYNQVEYRTAILPGCPSEGSSLFSYPVALSCHCGACNTAVDECAHRASSNRPTCTKPVRHIYQSNFLLPF
ncbi:thyroid stimulating hormone subunit beta a [Gadus macrocephalus]|uniref:thyroid stimulating hormone subunit beta a n=1 Tax=Gadus macrocephalus TaxID=80720 RepID=UPI0028CB3A4E|nr:thyroid stimulating hormone subunit beta a [Gadus macrocephalus]